MILKSDYLENPCGLTSIPYWKYVRVSIPDGMAIVHNKDFNDELYKNYIDEPYFRLYHNLKDINSFDSNEVDVIQCTPKTIGEFVNLINDSYSDIKVTLQQIEGYCKIPVYYPDLWIFIKDKKTANIVGGGIGDFDQDTGEMILEWIQVLPKYRRRGYGQLIVNYMLAKMVGIARFATVSGKVNNPNKPENLYRKCGFTGNDIWHILTKKA